MEYGIVIFNGNKANIKRFTKANSLESFGCLYLKSKLREEGMEYNVEGLRAYLNSWLEWDEEMADESGREAATDFSQMIDFIADTLTYSNVHLQKLIDNVWQPLSSEDKKVFFQAIVERLESVPQVA